MTAPTTYTCGVCESSMGRLGSSFREVKGIRFLVCKQCKGLHPVAVYHKAGSKTAAGRVHVFFTENPWEELTVVDVMKKFDLRESTAREIIRRLMRSRVVESVHVIRRHSGFSA